MSDPHETPHPLDEALRRRLGSYGEEPGAHVWAGVRAHLPGAPPPGPRRWQRPARRLGVLLSLLVGIWLLVKVVKPTGRLSRSATEVASSARAERDSLPAPRPAGLPASSAVASKSARATIPQTTALPPARRQSLPAPLASAATSATRRPPGPSGQPAATGAGPSNLPSQASSPAPAAVRSSDSAGPLGRLARSASRPAARLPLAALAKHSVGRPALRSPAGPVRPAGAAAGRPAPTLPPGQAAATAGSPAAVIRPHVPKPTAGAAAGVGISSVGPGNQRVATLPAPALTPLSPASGTLSASDATRQPLASLLFKETAVSAAVTPGARPETLTSYPDSASRLAPTRRRRWAVQAMAGPTLSYRTLRQSEANGLAMVAASERPGLGWGAQVQARRVLSGRWALAAGLGFQQYATQPESPSPASALAYAGQVALSESGRNTYNLLVAPVQLSYALGRFSPRWQVAAVGGLEPGRYLGGRGTTVVSSSWADANANAPIPSSPVPSTVSSFRQRSYAGAEASPYRPWNLGLSLGLDLRYRLAPASRWQLLVQPTARGVVSPFARAAAADYSRRPFSLGLLTGLSWDVH